MIRSLALAALALPMLAAADDRFDALRTRAERVDSLGSLLERYLGSCRDPFTRADCERNVGAARRSIHGKVLWARVLKREYKARVPIWGIAAAPLVDGDRADPGRHGQLGHELLERVRLPGERGNRQPERLQDLCNVRRGEREAGLHHRLPALKAGRVDLPEHRAHRPNPGELAEELA